MKKSILCLLLCGLVQYTNAQVYHRLGLQLYYRLTHTELGQSEAMKQLFVIGNTRAIKEATEHYQGVFKYAHGRISSISIPYKNLIAFSNYSAIEQIDATDMPGTALMDSARINNNIDSAQQGIAPLTQGYTGKGVVVGIIDGGIYFRHTDFRQPNGDTRILSIWDQVVNTGTAPSPYLYGSVWDSAAINAGLCTHKAPANDYGHGTNVAGIAVGNGLSYATDTAMKKRYMGVATEADIVVVRIDYNSANFNQSVADAIDYIFVKAAAVGKPCVINTSLGSYYGPHDGSEIETKMIENLLDQKHGRVLVAAAGNGGAVKHHLSYPLSPTDSLFTWFQYNASSGMVYFDLWADTTQFNHATFALGCDNSTPSFLARTKYLNVLTDFTPTQGTTVQIDDSLFQGTTKLGNYTVAVTLLGDKYHVEFIAIPLVTTYLWRLQTMGQGQFDLWASKSLLGTSNMPSPLPGGFTSPNYRYPDSLKTIVSGWQCSDKVITVGNYSNRANYLDKDSHTVNLTIAPYNEIVGNKAANSSLGPTRNGRMKPDISATGSTTISTGDSSYIASLIANNQGYKVGYGGKHTRNGGTSMSSPIVAGAVALYLQEHPNASYREVAQILEWTAKTDNFTTAQVPNYSYGYGKLNTFRALSFPVIYGCMDSASLNYNPLATYDTGVCIRKVLGCTDTGSINYNPLANVNDGSCVVKVYGCMDTASINYNLTANVSSGNCIKKVYGCTDTGSVNYNATANVNTGHCIPKVYGCMDTSAYNYNAAANISNGNCIAKVYGCTDTGSINYNPTANIPNGSCIKKVYGCRDTASLNYNPLANVDNGHCVAKIYGCKDTGAINYNAAANVGDGSCIAKVYGCKDTGAINYNAAANVDNGLCVAKVYGVMDTTCHNYNAKANVNRGNCQTTEITKIMDDSAFDIYPNPFSYNAILQLTQAATQSYNVEIVNTLGQTIQYLTIPEGVQVIMIDGSNYAKGMYFAILSRDSIVQGSRRFVIE